MAEQPRRPSQRLSTLPLLPLVSALLSTAAAALFLGIFSLAVGEDFWSENLLSKDQGYCEDSRVSSSVRTPANSWSNLAYVTSGGWVLGRAAESWHGGREHQEMYPAELPLALSILAGLCSVSLGFGSFFFHAVLVRWALKFDVGAMYWVGNAALTATLWRWLRRVGSAAAPRRLLHLSPVLATNMIADVFMYVPEGVSATYVFGSQISITILSEAFHMALAWPPRPWTASRSDCACSRRPQCRIFLVGLGSLLSGLAGLSLREVGEAYRDRRRETGEISWFCDPKGFFQPHAAWHVLAALALAGLWELQLGRQPQPAVAPQPLHASEVVLGRSDDLIKAPQPLHASEEVLGRSDVLIKEDAEPALDNPDV